MAETNSAVKFYRTTSSAFSSATKEDGALYFLTDVGKIYLAVGTGSSQTLYQMSVSPSDIVSNVAQGDGNGQIKVTKNGSASNVSVKGLKSAAYTESTDYATSGHTHDTRYVRFDTSSQGLTSTQKSNARTNIGAGTSSFSGSYNDLTNKPTIPAAQVNSDWNASSGVAQILNKPTLASVAISGSYGDLSNKPSIPSKDSDLSTNDRYVRFDTSSQGLSSTQKSNARTNIGAGTSSFSGSYNDLTNKPTIPAAQVNSDWNASSGVAQILNKPTLASVATSGSYNDLSNKPSIPSKDSDITNDQYVRFDTSSQGLSSTQKSNARTNIGAGTSSFSGSYNDLTNKPTIPAAQVNSDWNASSGVAQILNKPALATVATSGSYNDLSNKPSIPTDTNQKIKVGSVTFGTNDVIDIVAGNNVTVTGLASGTGAPKITISAEGSGGAKLYRHNIHMVIKTGTSSSGYSYYHCHFYTINSSSTAITHSSFYGSYGENYIKYPIQGGYVIDSDDYGYGRSMSWLPRFSAKNAEQRELLIAVRDVYNGVAESYISAASAYQWTDTVETLN